MRKVIIFYLICVFSFILGKPIDNGVLKSYDYSNMRISMDDISEYVPNEAYLRLIYKDYWPKKKTDDKKMQKKAENQLNTSYRTKYEEAIKYYEEPVDWWNIDETCGNMLPNWNTLYNQEYNNKKVRYASGKMVEQNSIPDKKDIVIGLLQDPELKEWLLQWLRVDELKELYEISEQDQPKDDQISNKPDLGDLEYFDLKEIQNDFKEIEDTISTIKTKMNCDLNPNLKVCQKQKKHGLR